MRFTVPQFIEQEAKIIGPLTFKQFIYIGSAGVIGFILFQSLPSPFSWLIVIVLGLSAFALAFLKINGKSLPIVIVNFFKFLFSSKIYLWQKEKTKTQTKINIEVFEESPSAFKETLTKESQLKKLSTKIDTK